MGMPCKLFIKTRYKEAELSFVNDDDIKSFSTVDIPEFKELEELYVEIQGECELKIDGFDDLDGNILSNGWNSIIDKKVYLFSFDKKLTSPLIPGYYQIMIRDSKNNIFYSWFKITPKNMSEYEWELMKDEVEKEVKGLSLDLKYRNSGFNFDNSTSDFNNITFNKVAFLSKEYSKFCNIISNILLNPKNKINNNYSWQDIGKKAQIDSQTIKYRSKYPNKKNFLYTSKRYLDYNIKDNKELVFTLKYIQRVLTDSKVTINKYLNSLNSNDLNYIKTKSFLEKNMKIIHDYDNILNNFFNTNWVRDVQYEHSIPQYTVRNRDYKYNYIYSFYLTLMKNSQNKELNSSYQLYWKRSDLLYEIWGYLKIIILLKEEGYVPISGWIFDDTSFEIPFLKEGTTLILKKENIELYIIYNKKIPQNNDGLNIYDPIYIKTKNNKPDIRIDVFKDNYYCKSIIMDTKYRNFINLWERSEGVQTQLRSYKDSVKSKVLFKNSNNNLEEYLKTAPHSISPIAEVWVLFPRSSNTEKETSIEADEKICFREFSPKKDLNEIKNKLIELINKLVSV